MFKVKEVVPIRRKNTFWTADLKAYREATAKGQGMSTTKSEIEAIEKGIRASVVLNDPMTQSFAPSPADGAGTARDIGATGFDGTRGDLRRAYASNALEDALFVGDGGINTDTLRRRLPRHEGFRRLPRNEGFMSHNLFDIDEEGDGGDDDLANQRRSLMRTANCIPGGLPEAGSVLFSQLEGERRTLMRILHTELAEDSPAPSEMCSATKI